MSRQFFSLDSERADNYFISLFIVITTVIIPFYKNEPTQGDIPHATS